ncbi:MAG TPA: DUF4180 domain-containing protein [Candidatus Cloacimonadota bacterium]|nr:DUF4180 domain-containing protein [Candidatus Cloacimonadota bacterium]HPS38465.1 DUF4180 domain-containing protein [Candidatus Cloacimonadota bacterium]
MKFIIHEIGEIKVAELSANTDQTMNAQDALDIMMEATYLGADVLMLRESSLDPGFFDLSTRIAGDIAQKAVNYRFRIMIIGDFEKYRSKSLREYIRESNLGKHVNFFARIDEAWELLRSEAGGLLPDNDSGF